MSKNSNSKQQDSKNKKKTILIWALAGAAILIVAAVIILLSVLGGEQKPLPGASNTVVNEQTDEDLQSEESQTDDTQSKPTPVDRNNLGIAAQSEHYEITAPMMEYFFNKIYQNFVDYYGDYLYEYIGVDISADIRQQNYDQNTTWFEYFEEQTKIGVNEYLALCEKAIAEGIQLTQEEKEAIRTSSERIKAEDYGDNVITEDIVKCLEITTLANKYSNIIKGGVDCSDEQIEGYYDDNKKLIQMCDYVSISMSYNQSTYQDILKKAQYMAESTSEEQLLSRIGEYYEQQFGLPQEDIQSVVDSAKKINATYTNDEAGDFLFDEATHEGDTVLIDMPSYSSIDIYILTKKPYRDESETKNVRHILVTDAVYDSAEAAQKKAQELLEQWENGEATNDSFGLLALAYSEDAGSCSNGGLYKNIKKGQMVEQFEAWCFDNSRKTGDTGIVQTDYGYHIMYFEGDGDIAWRAQIKDNLITAGYNEICDALIENTAVTYNEDVIYNIQVKA